MLAQSLIAGEEECVALPDGTADRGSEVVALQRSLVARHAEGKARRCAVAAVEVVARIQRLIAEVVEDLTVEPVSARARADVHDRTRAAAVLRAERRVVDLELRRRIDRRLERDLVLAHVVQVDAIDLEVHRVFAVTRGDKGARAETAAGAGKAARRRSHNASGSQHREIEEVTAVERQILHGVLADDLAHRHRLGFDLLDCAFYLHRLTSGGNSKVQVDGGSFINLQCHILDGVGAEARGRDLHLIVAGLKRGNNVDASVVCDDGTVKACGQRVDQNMSVRNHGTAGVGDDTRHSGRGLTPRSGYENCE